LRLPTAVLLPVVLLVLALGFGRLEFLAMCTVYKSLARLGSAIQ
jgi:hypothetical protein